MWGCFDNFHSFIPFGSPGFGGGFSLFGLLVWLILLAVIVALVRAFWPQKQHQRGARADRDDALRILRNRLAEGAISEEEFERLKRAVES